jgi:hypothetical protein
LIVLALAFTAVACGPSQDKAMHVLSGSEQGVSGQRQTSTPEWSAEGDRLRAAKKDLNARYPDGRGAVPVGNSADFAYQSLPVDVTGTGVYVFLFGPVNPDFNWPVSPSSLTYQFPSDTSFVISPAAGADKGPTIITDSGSRFLMVSFEVKDFRAAYPQFSAWIY